MPADFLARFENYTWPGNVRELYNAVARRRALGDLDAYPSRLSVPPPPRMLTAESAPPTQALPSPGDRTEEILQADLPFMRARDLVVEDFERRYVARSLLRWGGSATKAAAAAGIARRYFYDIKRRSET